MRNKVEIQIRMAEVERNIKKIIDCRNQALKTPFYERDKNVFIFWHLEEKVNQSILNELKWFLEDDFSEGYIKSQDNHLMELVS